jgi:hypothetical protein
MNAISSVAKILLRCELAGQFCEKECPVKCISHEVEEK